MTTSSEDLFRVVRSDNRDVERSQLNKILRRLADLAAQGGPPLSSTTPAAIGTAAVGVGTTAARADHVHAHGNQAGGSLHADVVAGGASGFMSGADKTKLNGIAAGATANATDAQLRDRSTHTGTQSLDTTTDSATRLAMTAAERTKLSGVATGATANATDAQLRDRSTHTGTQAFSTIAGTVPVGQGGTGLTTLTTGNFIRAASASTMEQRTPAQVLADIGAAPASHTHTASQISDSTAAGRSLLTAADAAAQRTALDTGGLNTVNTWHATQVFGGGTVFGGAAGSEGGQVDFQAPVTGSSFGSNIHVDVQGNDVRFFAWWAGQVRGYKLNFANATDGQILDVLSTRTFATANTWTGTNTYTQNVTIGDGTTTRNLTVQGATSGANSGAFVGARIGSTGFVYPGVIGNRSSIHGGAYNPQGILWSAGTGLPFDVVCVEGFTVNGSTVWHAGNSAQVQAGTVAGQVPVWNATSNRYEPGTPAGQVPVDTPVNYHSQYISYANAGIV